jgi:hypothetical protein
MTCKRTDLGGGFVHWSCSRKRAEPVPTCEVCKVHPQAIACRFELRGARAGQTCGRKICQRCARGTVLCPPHAKVALTSP